jgi:hypothetical protein
MRETESVKERSSMRDKALTINGATGGSFQRQTVQAEKISKEIARKDGKERILARKKEKKNHKKLSEEEDKKHKKKQYAEEEKKNKGKKPSKDDARMKEEHDDQHAMTIEVGLCRLNQVDPYPIAYNLSNA